MGTAEWLFLTLLRSTYSLHTFHNSRHMAPIHWVMQGFAVYNFMEHSRTKGSSRALLSASITLVEGKSKECLWINLWIYRKDINHPLFAWVCIISGKRKHKERGLSSDCHWGKLEIGQEEKVKTKERTQSRAAHRTREERNRNKHKLIRRKYMLLLSPGYVCPALLVYLVLNIFESRTLPCHTALWYFTFWKWCCVWQSITKTASEGYLEHRENTVALPTDLTELRWHPWQLEQRLKVPFEAKVVHFRLNNT